MTSVDKWLLDAIEVATRTGIAAVNPDGAQMYVNPAFCRMVGWTREELVGRRPPFLYWPPEEVAAIEEALALTIAGRPPSDGCELRFMRRSGERFDVEVLIAPVHDEQGRGAGWLASVHDITERKRTEAEQRKSRAQLAEAQRIAQIGSWEWDMVADRITWSEELYRLYGVDPAGFDASFQAYLERLHEDDREHMQRTVQQLLEDGIPFSTEHRLRRPDGEVRVVHARGWLERDAAGRPIRMAGTGQDITDRRRREEERLQEHLQRLELERQRALMEEDGRRKDEFLALLGHELRNPLAPIVTALELMKLRGAGMQRERDVIERQVHHMVQLVNDLLDISRIKRGMVALRRQPVEVAQVMAKAVEMASPLLEQRAHNLAVSVPRRGLVVDGDPVRLAQVFANLLTNAARYTEPGGHIEIAAEERGGEVCVRVRDDGVGIAAELMPGLFEPFVQGARVVAGGQGGLGLGLPLVRSLVALHGGRTGAHSDGPGRGSEFAVWLPRTRLPAAPEAAALAGAAARPAEARTVLVVDDNRDAAETLAESLRDHGHDVLVAHDGPQAIALAARAALDAAILDIGLPVMDGYELARRLRERHDLLLIALTGYGQDTDRGRSERAGFALHLVKPAPLVDILAALDGGRPA